MARGAPRTPIAGPVTMRRPRRIVFLAIGAAAAVLIAGRVLSGLYVEYQWYAGMHATTLWRARMSNLVLLTGATAMVITLFVFGNLYAVRRSIVSVVFPRRMGNLEIGEEVPARYLTVATAVSSLALGILLALPPEPWVELAAARYGVPFGESDPYFQMDLGFFVYWLPLETALYVRTLLVLLVTVFVVIVLYFAVTPSLRWDRTRFRITAHVRRHAAALTPFIFAVVAWMYRLDAFGALAHGSAPNGAFTYTDHHFMIPADRTLALLTLAAGFVAAFTLWRGQLRSTAAVVGASLLVPLIVFQGAPMWVRRGADAGDRVVREEPYGVIRVQATRAAYAVRQVIPSPLGAARGPGRLASTSDLAATVSLWDPAALSLALQRSVHRGTIVEGIGWQPVSSGLMALAVERGGDAPTTEGQSPGTVGGTLLAVAATVPGDRGAPQRGDLAGHSGGDESSIPPVLVYAGATEPLIVADSLDRIVAPRIDGLGSRIAQAWSAQRLNLLGADLPEPHPKLLARRDVRDRVGSLVPFFAQGSSVWPVLMADSLYWALDLYSSVPDTYPLSQHFIIAGEERSYFQHAATAFVHAYTGRIFLVADSVRDPIAETWVHRFPQLFVSWPAVPQALVSQTPPEIDGALAAATGFAASGALAGAPPGDRALAAERVALADNADTVLGSGQPPCIALNFPEGVSCTWSVPLVDARDRVTGVIVATGGTRRRILWVPVDSTAPRWTSALDRLQRAADSGAVRREGPAARGRVRSVVIGDHLAMVQPEYAWRSDDAPSLTGVTVALGDTARAGETIALALGVSDTVLAPGGHPSAGPGTAGQFHSRVDALYDTMQSALRRGDLTAFGAAFATLGRLLGHAPDAHAPNGAGPTR
jgi:uncharacterized protein